MNGFALYMISKFFRPDDAALRLIAQHTPQDGAFILDSGLTPAKVRFYTVAPEPERKGPSWKVTFTQVHKRWGLDPNLSTMPKAKPTPAQTSRFAKFLIYADRKRLLRLPIKIERTTNGFFFELLVCPHS
ncbi:MAG TPA: hypothetical protein PKY51_08275 [Fimbriimonadaceae bacterium]|nr:hypothetical protein [Fimbriimonadaceae bacterium]